MTGRATPLLSDLSSSIDSDPTPRASRHNLTMIYNPPQSKRATSRSDDAPLHYFDDEFEEQERRWRESRPLLRHVPPPLDEEGEQAEQDDSVQNLRISRYNRRSGNREDINLNDWVGWISIWLLTCLAVVVVGTAGVLIWILVTQ
jgi:hypothetical protein